MFTEVQRLTDHALELVRARAATGEVDRAITDAQEAFAKLADLLGPSKHLAKSQLVRHLGWMNRYYRDGEHGQYASDLVDIRERDLPAVAIAVQQWERSRLDAGLVDAVDRAWRDGDYRAVIRDAFVHLEERLRTFGGIDPTAGLSGSTLVDTIFGPAGDGITRLPAGALLGPVTGGERTGLVHLFKGAFLFARNPTSHRRVEHSADEAHALLQMVDLCLRVISAPR